MSHRTHFKEFFIVLVTWGVRRWYIGRGRGGGYIPQWEEGSRLEYIEFFEKISRRNKKKKSSMISMS